MMTDIQTHWRREQHEQTVTLWFDMAGRPHNCFSAESLLQLDQLLQQLEQEPSIDTVLIRSAKKQSFIVGADLLILQQLASAEEALTCCRQGQHIFQRLARLPQRTVALIHGPCLGGGFECALACDFRIAIDDPATSIGLPEVQLGILPAWGGSTRLPRLIGLLPALDLIGAGKAVDSRKALKLGMVDVLLNPALQDEQLSAWLATAPRRPRRRSRRQWLERWPLRRMVQRKAVAKAQAKAPLLPAPAIAMSVVCDASRGTIDHGLELEQEAFVELATSEVSKNLVHLFFVNEYAKKINGLPGASKSHQPKWQASAVLGAGTMGGHIGWLLADRGHQVALADINDQALLAGIQTVHDTCSGQLKRRRRKPHQFRATTNRVSPYQDPLAAAQHAEVVIEAVIEDLGIKQQLLQQLSQDLPASVPLLTNTSSLRVADLVQDCRHPERIAGFHFFNPVPLMPLIEIVAGPQTDPELIAQLVSWSRQLKKTPIVVQDCAGFLVNRILLPYLNEAAWLLHEGVELERIDRVCRDFGLPMGPFVLADAIGIPVGYKVAHNLAEAYGPRMAAAPPLLQAYEAKLAGKRSGEGFYHYQAGDKSHPTKVQQLFTQSRPTTITDRDIIDRCLLIMILEASRCLQEGIIDDPRALDLALITGTGFPVHTGGLLHWADQHDRSELRDRAQELASTVGERFAPGDLLAEASFHLHPSSTTDESGA